MGPMEMVVAIVGIGAVANIYRAKHGLNGGRRRFGPFGSNTPFGRRFGAQDDTTDLAAENTALRDEMRGMKERIQVLERLATDDESDARRLDREIEKLRGAPTNGATQNRE